MRLVVSRHMTLLCHKSLTYDLLQTHNYVVSWKCCWHWMPWMSNSLIWYHKLSWGCLGCGTQACLGAGFMESFSWPHSLQVWALRLWQEGTAGAWHRSLCTVHLFFSWRFTCIDLWTTCVHRSAYPQVPLAHSPVLVHQIDLLPLAQETGVFCVDEIIIADTSLIGDYQIPSHLWTCLTNANLKLFCSGCQCFNGEGRGGSPSCMLWSGKKMWLGLCVLDPQISLARSLFPIHAMLALASGICALTLILPLSWWEALVLSSVSEPIEVLTSLDYCKDELKYNVKHSSQVLTIARAR